MVHELQLWPDIHSSKFVYITTFILAKCRGWDWTDLNVWLQNQKNQSWYMLFTCLQKIYFVKPTLRFRFRFWFGTPKCIYHRWQNTFVCYKNGIVQLLNSYLMDLFLKLRHETNFLLSDTPNMDIHSLCSPFPSSTASIYSSSCTCAYWNWIRRNLVRAWIP